LLSNRTRYPDILLSLTNKPLITDFKAEAAEGLRALNEGKSVPFDEEMVERIKRTGRAKFEAAMKTNSHVHSALSRPGDFRPQPLAEPYVTVSRHTVPIALPPALP
jgi:hypothetical protein